jgi:hypothetical protein
MLAAKITLLVEFGYLSEEPHSSGRHLLGREFIRRSIHLRKKLIPSDFSLLLRYGPFAFARTNRLVFAKGFDGAIRLKFVVPVSEDP